MSEKPELNWEQLNKLTEEVLSDHRPGTDGWKSDGSHTQAFNEHFIEEFRNNGGKMSGELGAVDFVLLTAKGAKSGQPRTIPLSYYTIDGRMAVIASMGGAPNNPPWFHNVKANPDVVVEVGDEKFDATAIITEGEDRNSLFAEICQRMPVFAEYQERTERVIPVIELKRNS